MLLYKYLYIFIYILKYSYYLIIIINIYKTSRIVKLMDGWKYYEGKRVFIILKNKRQYSGTIIGIESNSNSPLIWIILKDKFGNRITFVNSEVELIQEETDNE